MRTKNLSRLELYIEILKALETMQSASLLDIEEKADITMPELAAEFRQETGTKADPASLSRWLIRNGYRFKKTAAREECHLP